MRCDISAAGAITADGLPDAVPICAFGHRMIELIIGLTPTAIFRRLGCGLIRWAGKREADGGAAGPSGSIRTSVRPLETKLFLGNRGAELAAQKWIRRLQEEATKPGTQKPKL